MGVDISQRQLASRTLHFYIYNKKHNVINNAKTHDSSVFSIKLLAVRWRPKQALQAILHLL